MRILVTGAKGMLGSEVCLRLAEEHEVAGVDVDDFDITHTSAADEVVRRAPQIVCHLAAYTDVDGCEKDPDRAHLTNAVGTRNIAQGCRRLAIPMLYISTDYVFDGEKDEPYHELDPPNPLNVYGRSKLEGETYVNHLLKDFYIVRSSWLFGKKGGNFVDKILSLALKEKTLKVVSDQVGSPTYTPDLASALSLLLTTRKYGIYHITNSGSCSWYQFALKILLQKGVEGVQVLPIDTESSHRPARRPKNSVLSNSAFRRTVDHTMRSWENALAEYLKGT